MPTASTTPFSVIASTLCAQDLLDWLLPAYDIPRPTTCTLLYQGLNDTYRVETTDARTYILRVYRYGWRTLHEISYETEVLQHLAGKGVTVAAPIIGRDGAVVRVVAAPEGDRYAVLFTHAAGGEVSLVKRDAVHLGRALGALHSATEDFASHCLRPPLDRQHLIERPLNNLEPFFLHRAQDWTYVQDLAERVWRRVQDLLPLDQGFCHGDVHELNVFLSEDKTVTFFDFDCCGFGWRAYDLAVLKWSARWQGKERTIWAPFLRGYQETRHLLPADLQSIPYFVILRNIWLMGLHAGHTRYHGLGQMRIMYLDRHLTFLRNCDRDYLKPNRTP